ncbi:MAG TPA: serine/threonine-protein kinase [Kofleriaceae bacterium]
MKAFTYGLRIGKYEIREELGHGGYGIVYRARDTELDRDLAMKFLRAEYVSRVPVLHRFLQEARSAAKIVHPGIVTVYECGHVEDPSSAADGSVYIAMELLAGGSLGDRLAKGRLAIETAMELAGQLAAALEAAHNSGIVHRDLKPDNVILVLDASLPGGERVKILDFGIAKLNDADLGNEVTGVHTHSMMMLGTPRYMSPEQCRSSAKVDHRSDIYTLGCILYEMLCGQSPYEGDAGELIAKHQLAAVPRPRALRPEVSAYLDVLVTTMLAKDPADRPQSMERVREAIAACARGERWARGLTQAAEDPPEPPDTTLGGAAGAVDTRRSRAQRAWWFAAGAAAVAAVLVPVWLIARGPAHSVAALPDAHVAAVIAPPPAPAPMPTSADRTAKELACRKFAGARQWDELLLCADELARSVPAGDPVVRELTTMGVIEARNATYMVKVQDQVTAKDLTEAYRWLDRIDDESVYKEQAADEIDRLARTSPHAATVAVRACNADKLAQRAQQAITLGQYTSALALLEGSLRCRPDPSLYRVALLAACNAGNATKAKAYFARLTRPQQPAMAQLCLRNAIALP